MKEISYFMFFSTFKSSISNKISLRACSTENWRVMLQNRTIHTELHSQPSVLPIASTWISEIILRGAEPQPPAPLLLPFIVPSGQVNRKLIPPWSPSCSVGCKNVYIFALNQN